jgi:zinc protease
MIRFTLALIVIFLLSPFATYSQGLKSFKLQNGLTVYVWEDASQSDVYGMVTVKAGSVNDPEEYTGLAHYLEHVMFKGTDRIGALDWFKEKPIYEQIIAKYDERAAATSPAQVRAIDEEINLLTAQQAALTKNNEFRNLVESIGGTGLNAGTGYDQTMYFNSFPKVQLDKWLDLYSVRFMNPVFRTFQTELETVYEEFNMYKDDPNDRFRQVLFSQLFAGTPYQRSIIGHGEHLKNPRLSKLIEFYEQFYVPENMALILVGDLNTEEVAAAISRRFSRLPAKTLETMELPELPRINGRKQIRETVGLYPQVVLAFNGVAPDHRDYPAIIVMTELLSNSSQTGILDKLGLDGDVMYSIANDISVAGGGRILVQAIPSYDYNQGRYESFRFVERLLLDNLKKLSDGSIDEGILISVKGSLTRDHLTSIEEARSKGMLLSEMFVKGWDMEYVLNYPDVIGSVSLEDVQRVARTYLTGDFLALHISEEGNIKPEKLVKPELSHAIEFPFEGETVYSQWFNQLPVASIEMTPVSYEDVKIERINEKSRLFYTPNTENDVFSMTIKYMVGEREMPKLEYATSLMNSAGVLGAFEPSEFREALSRLNATVNYYSDDDYVTVYVEGVETYLVEICNLITRQILMPKLEEKQLNQLKGAVYQSRRIEKEQLDVQQNALFSYMRYGESSSYLTRMKWHDVIKLGISELTAVFQNATDYAAEIHYTGRLSFEDVHNVLSSNLPLKAMELDGDSPQDKPYVEHKESLIYFVANNKANQSRILFFQPLDPSDYTLDAKRMGFNRYFGSGSTGLVFKEIREKRSMAYDANALVFKQRLAGSPLHLFGFVGTQADKTNEAVDVFMDLVNDMPHNAERIEGIKSFLSQALITGQPSFRKLSMDYEMEKLLGFEAPRSKVLLPYVEALAYEDIVEFYEEHIRGKPMVIGIVGNPSEIDLKALEKHGKVIRLNVNRLFND